jgi:ATP-dependent 26S proteasome regulatory subunit
MYKFAPRAAPAMARVLARARGYDRPPPPAWIAMDDNMLASLCAALRTSPDNAGLRMVLVRAHLERGEPAEAAALLDGIAPHAFAAADRVTCARALLDAGLPELALEFAAGDEAPAALLLVRARALLALERLAEGLRVYDAAVAAEPALEDRDLRARLAANVREFRGAGGEPRRLKVISNDDTDAEDVARLLVPETETVRFADVGGLDAIKRQIHKRIILPYQKPSLFQRFRKRVGGGILLYGPPGCGKTLLARATAGECDACFFNIAISDVLDMYIGESERKLHALFEKARASVPAVLFFDEVEALGGKRQYSRDGNAAKLVSQFLAELDGFAQNNSGVLVLGATNVPWAVDPAFRRPGRFDRLLFVPPPDATARAAVLGILLAGRPTRGALDLAGIARRTSGFSGADLRNLVETAADAAIDASIASGAEVPIDQTHLQAALAEVRSTTVEWLTTARNYARYANEGGQYDEVLAFLKEHGRD